VEYATIVRWKLGYKIDFATKWNGANDTEISFAVEKEKRRKRKRNGNTQIDSAASEID